jgi:hypothetical protein
MVRRIVLFKLKESAEGAGKAENLQKMKAMLEGMKGLVKEIKALEVGLNFGKSEAHFDLALLVEFENEAALQTYAKHPGHLKVIEFVSKIKEDRVLVDYEV